jgi:hypothetical protein
MHSKLLLSKNGYALLCLAIVIVLPSCKTAQECTVVKVLPVLNIEYGVIYDVQRKRKKKRERKNKNGETCSIRYGIR